MVADNSDRQSESTTNRRSVLKAGGIAAVALASGGIGVTGAQSETEGVEITTNPEEEYVTIRNTSESEVDLTGYAINFDAEGGNDQIRELAGEVVIGPDGEVTVATGDQTSISADVSLAEPYEGHVLNNDGSDIVALLNPSGNEVARSDGSSSGDDDGGDEGNGDDGDDDGSEVPDEDEEDDQQESEDPDDSSGDDSEEPPEDDGDEDVDESESEDESEDADSQADDSESETGEDDDCPKN